MSHERDAEYWRSLPRSRPEHPVKPGPGQVSVWDFPRPPRLESVPQRVRVEFASIVIADTSAALRVCETASPPAYYVAPADVLLAHLTRSARETFCEWKGITHYWDLRVDERLVRDAAWSYPQPDAAFAPLRDYFAFHAGRVDACVVGEVRVTPQPGEYYGGWITPELTGPFKGEPGTEGW